MDLRAEERMADPDKELWVDLYRMAMMELENAKIAGRIGDARLEIAARLDKLREIPGLHTVEKQAIDDAMSSLHGLERIEERDVDHERRIAEKALQSLRVIGPRFENPKQKFPFSTSVAVAPERRDPFSGLASR